MKYAIIILLFVVVGCQKEIQWPEEQTEKPKTQNCKYKIVNKFRYEIAGGEFLGAFQLGGTADAGWYQHETTTYFVMVHDTLYNKYNKGDYLPINPNQ